MGGLALSPSWHCYFFQAMANQYLQISCTDFSKKPTFRSTQFKPFVKSLKSPVWNIDLPWPQRLGEIDWFKTTCLAPPQAHYTGFGGLQLAKVVLGISPSSPRLGNQKGEETEIYRWAMFLWFESFTQNVNLTVLPCSEGQDTCDKGCSLCMWQNKPDWPRQCFWTVLETAGKPM